MESIRIAAEPIRKAVIDAGPLFSALVLHHVSQQPHRKNPSPYIKCVDSWLIADVSRQEQFLNLLASIRHKLTTSHVIAELNGLERSKLDLFGAERQSFWANSIDLLTQWSLDEELVRMLDLARRTELHVTRIGLIDAGVIELARARGCVLITQDERTLAPHAWELGVDCRLVKQIV
jgi:rRNA-processing protein FCF1